MNRNITTYLKKVIVQASSRSWTGEKDECMYRFDGSVRLVKTLNFFSELVENSPTQITLVAPEFESKYKSESSGISETLKQFGIDVDISFSHDESPLLRMIDVCTLLNDEDFILRVNGQNCFIHKEMYQDAIKLIESNMEVDLVKFPDNYPAQMTFDIYRVGYLRRIASLISADSPLHIHPKYFYLEHDVNVLTLEERMPFSVTELKSFRNLLAEDPGDDFRTVNSNRVKKADQLSFHYELVIPHLKSGIKVLDLACGQGYGVSMMSKHLESLDGFEPTNSRSQIIGGDISRETLDVAATTYPDLYGVEWLLLDADRIELADNSIDLFTCFETLEHIPNLDSGLSEFARILSTNGIGFFSTPQNCFGDFPLTFWHEKEFSYEELLNAVSKHFEIIDFIGLKQGTVFKKQDSLGTNSFLIVRGKS
jgi:2-polyprenyl-3-methyl-5-hydroxy-6-metoxy-1,4-benzoquinol methylase